MAEARWPFPEQDLERALRDLGTRLAHPPTPDLATRVRARLTAESPRRRPFWADLFVLRRVAVALILVVGLLGGLLALWPEVRTAVADRLGLRGVTIFHVPAVPTPPAATPPLTATPAASLPASSPPPSSPTPLPAGLRLSLGQRVPLTEAQARAGFPVLLPKTPRLGQPDEIYYGEPPLGGQVALVYHARPGLPPAGGTGVGLLLTMFRGDLDPRFYGKAAGPGTRIEELTIGGERTVWLEGQPHLFIYRNSAGQIVDETVRLAGNVLLWERGDLTLRLEAAFSRDEALAIAASLE
jgi:hypothetical protein